MTGRRLRGGLLTLLLVGACSPAGPRSATPSPGLPRVDPLVRVGVAVHRARITASGAGGLSVLRDGRVVDRSDDGSAWTFTADTAGRLSGRNGHGPGIGPLAGPLELKAGRGELNIDGRVYRGRALLLSTLPDRLTAVNVVDLEHYLLGVVPAEMPALALEAMKAQAVAARTYAVGNMGARASLGFDFFGSVQDQAYHGSADENPMATRAVRETRGEILTYGGAPILAYYHSTCGGRTADVSKVWPQPPEPYLRSVSDKRPDGKGYYCDISSHFSWHVSWSGRELARTLQRTLGKFFGIDPARIGPIQNVKVAERTPSGRVGVLRIDAGGHSYSIRGDSIRWILRPTSGRLLDSDLFTMHVERSGGRVRGLRVDGHGWGHGVGMCQMGAIGRAEAGQSYRKILRTYYPGTRLTRLY